MEVNLADSCDLSHVEVLRS